jgi:glycosyltransferase involved in cell wall biosynthesis
MNQSENNIDWRAALDRLGIVVVIPTYNNCKTIGQVVADVKQYANHIIVVNDGSTDDTAQILSKIDSIEILTHERNSGKGTALKNGLCRAKAAGFRYAITIDSDGQHFASDIPTFVNEIEQTPDNLLVGSRNIQADNMPGKNTFANKFSNFWFRLETGVNLPDTQSGYRLYPIQLMNVEKRYYTAKYEFELEALVFASWGGIAVRNIPVHVYYPPEGERVSHFRPGRDFTRISILNTILVLIALLWIYPRNFCRKFTRENIKRFIDNNITHSPDSNARLTAAIMLGIFMGIIPIWGYQMIVAFAIAHLLKLNKILTLVASNISIPPMLPFLIYGSYYTGCKVLQVPIELTLSNITLESVKHSLLPYIVGSIVFAALCSVVVGAVALGLLTVFRRKKMAK